MTIKLSSAIRRIEDTLGAIEDVNLMLEQGFILKHEWSEITSKLQCGMESVIAEIAVLKRDKL